jgi:hypothetical protein
MPPELGECSFNLLDALAALRKIEGLLDDRSYLITTVLVFGHGLQHLVLTTSRPISTTWLRVVSPGSWAVSGPRAGAFT